MTKNKVTTRFPPSPTGLLQMGNIRTAIYNYLLAKQSEGQFIFRIEDTDKERSTKDYEIKLIEDLKWLGLNWDNPTFTRQSERGAVYQSYLEKMVNEGKAYISKEETGGDASKRSEVIRFKNPNKDVTFTDLIRGEITFNTADLKDFVIAKSMTEPIYHLAVVVDDFEGGITHIIRGEDHISNTPRQILIQEAIGAPRPLYAHLPLILDKDRAKLSKRKYGEKVSLRYFISEGYLPQSILNYMTMLGWNPGTDQELFTLPELVKAFDISKVQKSGAIFSEEKLRWFNKEHIKRIPDYKLTIISELKKFFPEAENAILEKVAPLVLERIETLGDVKRLIDAGEVGYFFAPQEYEVTKLVWKTDDKEKTLAHLIKARKIIETMQETGFTDAAIKDSLWPYAIEAGKGSVLWPMRFALSGKDKSPDPFVLASILGKNETLSRMDFAINKLKAA